MIPLTGYAPDAAPDTPGVVVDCAAMVPTLRGLAGAPSAVPVSGLPALAADARGAAVTVATDGTRRAFVGTAAALYEIGASAWSNVSRAGGYSGGTESRWSIAQFGNVALASDGVAPIQASSGGAFANISGAPAARVICSAANFVLAFNTSDGTYGTQGDRWWCSAFQDHSSWAPSLTTQATTGRLIGGGGELTAALPMGQQVVAYKGRDVFVGSYVGSPVVWQWDKVPGDVGCVGPDAVVDVGGAHLFVGQDNVWLFDGSRPQPLADGKVRDWLYNNISPSYINRTRLLFDRQNSRVLICFPSLTSSGECDTVLVYHLYRREFGRADMVVQAAFNFIASGATFDSLSGTFDASSGNAYDALAWVAGSRVPAVIDGSRRLVTLTGVSAGGSLTTGDLGDDDAATMLTRARLRFLREPAAATCTGYVKSGAGAALQSGGTAMLSDSGFDMRQSGRWHRLRFDFTGDVEITGLGVTTRQVGMR